MMKEFYYRRSCKSLSLLLRSTAYFSSVTFVTRRKGHGFIASFDTQCGIVSQATLHAPHFLAFRYICHSNRQSAIVFAVLASFGSKSLLILRSLMCCSLDFSNIHLFSYFCMHPKETHSLKVMRWRLEKYIGPEEQFYDKVVLYTFLLQSISVSWRPGLVTWFQNYCNWLNDSAFKAAPVHFFF